MAKPEDGSDHTQQTTRPVSDRRHAPNSPDSSETTSATCSAGSSLGRALFRMMRAVMFEQKSIPALEALPLAQMRLLWTVHYLPDATMTDFSERLSVSQSTVTQLADRLVRRGLVERQPDPDDRRVVRLHTSTTGQQLLAEAERERRLMLDTIWGTLSEQEQQDVLRGLEVLAKTAEALLEAQGRPLHAWPERAASGEGSERDAADPAQPVVDLMARRIRGRATP